MFFKYKTPLFIIKILNFEYWSWKWFYIPLVPYCVLPAYRARSLTFFTNINASITNDYQGLFGEDKAEILSQIDIKYLPITFLVNSSSTIQELEENILKHFGTLKYPIICKPNKGERGTDVEIINNKENLIKYFESQASSQRQIMIQEYIDHDIELGVFYIKMPNDVTGKVTSVTRKGFLKVTGDGKSSILELMKQSTRARFQIENMKTKMGNNIFSILAANQTLLLEPIGNHCRGTTFIDNNALINNQLNNVFHKIASPVRGFHYGRFDLKVKSMEDLYNGQNIKILELNGVWSEPAHIYDPNYKLWRAYKDLFWHWNTMSKISIQQSKKGIMPIPTKVLLQKVKKYFV